jgi:hypothetical protein
VRPRPPAPGRAGGHRRVERGPGIALPFRLLLLVAVVALGGGVLLLASGGLGRAVAAIGSTFNGLVSDLTSTPAPSAPTVVVSDAPTLEAPAEPYTNQAAIDLVGTVPAAVAGAPETVIRIYVAIGDGEPGIVTEVAVGSSQRFLVPNITLSPGLNTFTATIVGPTELESDASAAVAFVFDTSKPKVTVSSPKTNAIVNAKTVKLVGQTQARSALSAHNISTNQTVAGAADSKGAFSLVLPLGNGVNKIEVIATDPAGNVNKATLSVRRGTGALTARLSASFYQVKVSKLPEPVKLSVVVNDPDGKPLVGAQVTFTITVPGLPPIASSTLTTSSSGIATFTTTIPKGATPDRQCSVAVLVTTQEYGNITDRTVIGLLK